MTQNSQSPRRIVIGVDSSDNAARAASWAAAEAAGRGLPLHVVHAIDLPGAMGIRFEPPEFAARQRAAGAKILEHLTAQLREQRPGLTVTSEVSELGAIETMVELSRDAELVVTGTRGLGGFTGMLLGSVSHALAAHAHCPAVVVRGEEPAASIAEIVVGVEPGQAEPPIRFAFDTAAKTGAAVTIVRDWWPKAAYGGYGSQLTMPGLECFEADETADVDRLTKAVRADYPHVESVVHVIRGNPVPVLCNAATGARMLVVGAHRHRGPLALGIGYVVQGLLSHSRTPVAVVPIK